MCALLFRRATMMHKHKHKNKAIVIGKITVNKKCAFFFIPPAAIPGQTGNTDAEVVAFTQSPMFPFKITVVVF